jgi:hypothetical protein
MSICIAAMVVFAFMGIFSARYRRWAKEAMDCVGRRVTLRPCKTEFNQKVRAKLASKLLRKSPKAAKFAHSHFESISWIFTIILFVSLILTAGGLYNLFTYGTCDPANPDSCIFVTEEGACSLECNPCICGLHEVGCEAPEYKACNGNCLCVCESMGTMTA